MKRLSWQVVPVKAGTSGVIRLPQPHTVENYYWDVAVVAFPTSEEQLFEPEEITTCLTGGSDIYPTLSSLRISRLNHQDY